VAGDAGLHSQWKPTLNYFWDFTGAELLLLNPFFFIGAFLAAIAVWKLRPRHPLGVYLFCMGAPVFLGHWLYAFHSRVLPNWIAVSILPLLCLMVLLARDQRRLVRPFLAGGLLLGFVAVAFIHDSDLIGRLNGNLPGEVDPSHRVRAWRETAQLVEAEREQLATADAPAFIIAGHYGITGLLTFYSPAARALLPTEPLVYCIDADEPQNQFYFWPDYDYRAHRRGQNAIYVEQVTADSVEPGWFWHWLKREPVIPAPAPVEPPPPRMVAEFATVTDLGIREVRLKDRVFHRLHLWACHDLR
jgi:hypothetical protein